MYFLSELPAIYLFGNAVRCLIAIKSIRSMLLAVLVEKVLEIHYNTTIGLSLKYMTYRTTNRATTKSLSRYIYSYYRSQGTFPHPIRLGFISDNILKEALRKQLQIIARLIGYRVLNRKEATDYQWRKWPHIRIGLRAYALIPLQQKLTGPSDRSRRASA